MSNFWRVLELEPTDDLQKVRRAYARAAKKYHPEEQPEAFQQVREAYETAVAFLRSGEERADGDAALRRIPPAAIEVQPPDQQPLSAEDEAQPQASTPALLLEENEDSAAQYADCPALRLFREIYENRRWRKEQKRWQEFFTSPEFLAVQRNPGFTAALYFYLADEAPRPPQRLLLEFCIAYGVRRQYDVRQPIILPLMAFEGIEFILRILDLSDPIMGLDHETDKIRAACVRDYFQLQAMARDGVFEDPEKCDEWQNILSGYQKRQLFNHPIATRRQEEEITERHVDGIRLLAYFLTAHQLPLTVYHFLQKTLNLPAMERDSSTRQIYQPLGALVSAKLANVADTGPSQAETGLALKALQRHLQQYRLPVPFPHSRLLPAYAYFVSDQERRDTALLLSGAEFCRSMLDPDFIRENLLPEICGCDSVATVYLLRALIACYEPHCRKPGVRRLWDELHILLHRREHDDEFFFDRHDDGAGFSEEVAGKENREFWYYFLSAAFPAALQSFAGMAETICRPRGEADAWRKGSKSKIPAASCAVFH